MESSRKIMLGAIALLFFSQFFQYEDIGHTSITMDFTRNLTTGGLPYGGGNGWNVHAWWAHLPLVVLFAYLFYSAPRHIAVYWISALLFIFMGLGDSTGGAMGLISIAVYGFAVYKKIKEQRVAKSTSGEV